jgi:hypothetical protein
MLAKSEIGSIEPYAEVEKLNKVKSRRRKMN